MTWRMTAVCVAGALVIAAGTAEADLVCKKKKGQLLARTACKSKESPLELGSLLTPGDGLALTGNTLGLAAGGVSEPKVADGAITAAKIADGAITAAKITDHPRVLFFPSTALSFTDSMTDPFLRYDLGLRVDAHTLGENGSPPPAVLTIPRPPDYDGTSPVAAHLYFLFTYGPHTTDNVVRFRLKQYGIDLGDGLANAGWGNAATPLTVTDGYQAQREDFTVDPAVTSKQFWYLQFGRGDVLNGQNYPYPITIAGVELEYTAVQ